MHGRRIQSVICLLLFLVSGCGTIAGQVPTGAYNNVARVGVVTAIGDKFTMKQVGVTVFGNKDTSFPIDEWQLDERVKQDIAKALNPRFTFVNIQYDRDQFAASYDPKFEAKAVALPDAKNVDMIIAVRKWDNAPFYGTNQYFSGVGLWHQLRPGGKSEDYLCVFYQMVAIDARTGKTLAWDYAQFADSGYVEPAARKIDSGLFAEANQLTQGQKEALRERITLLLDETVVDAIKALKLN